jgi:bifunctional UDP-N-acetylglucosamine pyrophosphorylase/glucosamine-1-phosphate N-acetyltransferase
VYNIDCKIFTKTQKICRFAQYVIAMCHDNRITYFLLFGKKSEFLMVNHPSALILAAGLGKRMKSDLPKVLHRICGKSLAEHVLLNLADTPVKEIGIVVGHKQELVEETLGTSYSYYQQKEQLGTAHAVLQAQDFLKQHPGRVLILCGDAPLQTGTCLNAFLSFCEQQGLDLGVLTAILEEPGDYGRIIREDGVLRRITEKKDCSEKELKIKEINAGTYCFDSEKLLECLSEIQNQNSQNEYYLTDALALFLQKGYRTDAYVCDDPDVVKAVNTRWNCRNAKVFCASKINRMHTENGVTYH